jgi:hypothetical protein
MATEKQINFAKILLNEHDIDSRAKERDFLQIRWKKSFLDELTTKEASDLISELLEDRE